MNEAMRLLDRAIRPFGYDVRQRHNVNLLTFKGTPGSPELDVVRANMNTLDAARPTKLDAIHIVFRTCLTPMRCAKSNVRLESIPMAEVVERCFISLVKSINFAARTESEARPAIRLTILDDHSDQDLLHEVTRHAEALLTPWEVVETERSGQGWSLHQQFTMARSEGALFYFVEDDYLHVPSAIFEMWSFYKQIYAASGTHLIIHPQEHESLYRRSHGPSYLFLSPYRHWRSVSDATHCLFLHSDVVTKYWRHFENTKFMGPGPKRQLGSERRTTNRLFEYIPCFSPIPALAGHIQAEHCLPPHFDWRSLWEENPPAESHDPEGAALA